MEPKMLTEKKIDLILKASGGAGINGQFDLFALNAIEEVLNNHKAEMVEMAAEPEVVARMAATETAEPEFDIYLGAEASTFARKVKEQATELGEIGDFVGAGNLQAAINDFSVFWNICADRVEEIAAQKDAETSVEMEM
jgi:hypothetical protein